MKKREMCEQILPQCVTNSQGKVQNPLQLNHMQFTMHIACSSNAYRDTSKITFPANVKIASRRRCALRMQVSTIRPRFHAQKGGFVCGPEIVKTKETAADVASTHSTCALFHLSNAMRTALSNATEYSIDEGACVG